MHTCHTHIRLLATHYILTAFNFLIQRVNHSSFLYYAVNFADKNIFKKRTLLSTKHTRFAQLTNAKEWSTSLCNSCSWSEEIPHPLWNLGRFSTEVTSKRPQLDTILNKKNYTRLQSITTFTWSFLKYQSTYNKFWYIHETANSILTVAVKDTKWNGEAILPKY